MKTITLTRIKMPNNTICSGLVEQAPAAFFPLSSIKHKFISAN